MRTTLLLTILAISLPEGAEGRPTENPEQLVSKVVAAGRPRLFLRGSDLEQLRQAIRTTHRERWEKLQAAVDAVLDDEPPPYEEPRIGGDSTRPGTMNDEMLWQRQYGYKLPGMALVALLDGDPKYFRLVRKWALKPAEYPLWGAGIYENTGLAAKHQLFGISIAYDWLYSRWSTEDRAVLERVLREKGRILYEAAEGINDRGWWKEAWRQNHAWNGYQALSVTAIALAGEEPAAGTWLAKGVWGGTRIVAELPAEGAYEEGVPYWGYGMEALIRLVEAVCPFTVTDLYSAEYFRNTHLFRLYMAGPEIPQIANFGDGRTTDWHSVRSFTHRLAAQYRNPMAQWLAVQLPDRDDIDAACWNLLWDDPLLKPELPPNQPLAHVFTKTGFAGARTSWGPDALTLHLRSGQADVSHSHLDVNNFLVNVAGEWLLRDYGYGEVGPGYFNKRTLYFSTGTWGHNCLVIGGQPQRQDRDSLGVIRQTASDDRSVWWVSDATACYAGARTVARELLLVLPDQQTGKWGYIVVRDRAEVESPTTFDFLLQPGGKVALEREGFLITGKKARLAGRVLRPKGAELSVSKGLGENINVPDPLTLRVAAPGTSRDAEFLVVLTPLAESESIPVIGEESHVVRIGRHEIRLSRDGLSAPIIGVR